MTLAGDLCIFSWVLDFETVFSSNCIKTFSAWCQSHFLSAVAWSLVEQMLSFLISSFFRSYVHNWQVNNSGLGRHVGWLLNLICFLRFAKQRRVKLTWICYLQTVGRPKVFFNRVDRRFYALRSINCPFFGQTWGHSFEHELTFFACLNWKSECCP